jgi:hypothetical protein
MNGRTAQWFLSGILLLAGLPCRAQTGAVVTASGCPSPTADFLELREYLVAKIRFETPFDFLKSVSNLLASAKARLPQKEGELFRDGDVSAGTREIENILRQNAPAIGLPVNITVAIAYLENCNAQSSPKKLDVLYRVYTSRIPYFFSRAYESRVAETKDSAEAAGMTRHQRFRLLPNAGFEPERKLFAGGEFEVQKLGAIERLALSGEGSSESTFADANVEGTWSPGRPWLRQLFWRSGYSYSDDPSTAGRLKKSRGFLHASALLRDLGQEGPTLRAGMEIEGGNQGSRFDPTALSPELLSGSDYIAMKLFAGMTWRGRRQSMSLSYGLALADVGDGFGSGFRKHVGDFAYRVVILPRPHTPHELELRFAAGGIQNLGGVPVSDRFYGGGQDDNFLTGSEWTIRANPVIRSFGRNSLSRTDAGSGPPIGGDRFAAFNLTYAPTIWKRPLVPEELVTNQEFHNILEGQLNSAETTLALEYESRDPAIRRALEMKSELQAMRKSLLATQSLFSDAESQGKISPELEDRFLDCFSEVELMATSDMDAILEHKTSSAGTTLTKLVRKGGALDGLFGCEQSLRPVFGTSLQPHMTALKQAQGRIQPVLAQVDVARAAHKAESDMKFARGVLNTFLYEINLASIAPVFLYDAAWIGPQSARSGNGVRHGVGAGLRFSLASVARFTAAYSFNPNPKIGEKRGAFVLSLDVVDLFY